MSTELVPYDDATPVASDVGMPWDRSPGESDTAYEAFWYYCRLPVAVRSLGRAYDDLYGDTEPGEESGRRPNGTFQRWAANHRWHERAQAYDRWCFEEARKRAIAERMAEEQRSWAERAVLRDKLKRIANKALDRAGAILDADPTSKDLRDAVLAAERAAVQLCEKAYEGIRDAYQVEPDVADDLPPELAAEIQAAMVREVERRANTLTIEARRVDS